MIEVRRSQDFVDWLVALRDRNARSKIAIRIDRLQDGNLGDAKFFGSLGELRINYGPGYRVYYARSGNEIVLLLCGGDKKTQTADIIKAKEYWNDYKKRTK